jgi:hypothetical protein
MPDDAILGKFSTIQVSTGDGPLNAYECTVKLSEKYDKQPVKQHYLGKMDASFIPDTNCDRSGSLTVADKDGSFLDFYKSKVNGQKLGDTYPTIAITRTTKYKTGVTKTTTYRGVILSTQALDIEAESPQNIVYDWVAETVE